MKLKTLFVLLLFPGAQSAQASSIAKEQGPERQSFDKSAFYSIMASGDPDAVNGELTLLANASFPEKQAYEGALLMRKAGLLTIPAEKLRSFKSGRIKLESALLKDSANGEYHFLRLIIQEHAPGIVRYSKDLQKDSSFIRRIFKSLSPTIQKAILDYSKYSRKLSPEGLDPKKN